MGKYSYDRIHTWLYYVAPGLVRRLDDFISIKVGGIKITGLNRRLSSSNQAVSYSSLTKQSDEEEEEIDRSPFLCRTNHGGNKKAPG
uniref:Uncharacterized protein n=1 Tax=Salix viminalis TaxID=40686 RepID=A0A6N2M2G3_SALVM